MNYRAYSLIHIKRVDDDERVIEGTASTPTPDRQRDIVEPLGGVFTTPLPLLLDHDARQAVGHVEHAVATKEGITFRARIPKISEPGAAKDLVDRAWTLVKHRLRAAVSIGFRPLKDGIERMDNGGYRFKEWEWLELSLVSVPANAEAIVFEAKSLSAAAREIKKHERPTRTTRVVRLKEPRPPIRLTQEDINKGKIIAAARERAKGRRTRVIRLSAEDILNAWRRGRK